MCEEMEEEKALYLKKSQGRNDIPERGRLLMRRILLARAAFMSSIPFPQSSSPPHSPPSPPVFISPIDIVCPRGALEEHGAQGRSRRIAWDVQRAVGATMGFGESLSPEHHQRLHNLFLHG